MGEWEFIHAPNAITLQSGGFGMNTLHRRLTLTPELMSSKMAHRDAAHSGTAVISQEEEK
jgi:hypothetical protein